MEIRRRQGIPPYEVMASRPSAGRTPAGAGGSEGVSEHHEPSARPNGGVSEGGLWNAVHKPVRVPQGSVVLAGIVVLGVVLLAYQLGRTSGGYEARQQAVYEEGQPALKPAPSKPIVTPAVTPVNVSQPVAPMQPLPPSKPVVLMTPSSPGAGSSAVTLTPNVPGNTINTGSPVTPTNTGSHVTPAGTGGNVVTLPSGGNRPKPAAREEGMNYLVLARYPREEAQRLVSYLSRNGLDAIVVPTDDARLFHVLDLRGFSAEEMRGAGYDQHKQRLRQLGRVWKDREKGPSDLSDLWPQKYRGQ